MCCGLPVQVQELSGLPHAQELIISFKPHESQQPCSLARLSQAIPRSFTHWYIASDGMELADLEVLLSSAPTDRTQASPLTVQIRPRFPRLGSYGSQLAALAASLSDGSHAHFTVLVD